MRYISVDEFQLFLIEQKEFERRFLLTRLEDRFLDEYSKYLKTRSRFSGLRALAYARRIHELNPCFKFEMKE